MSLLPPPSPPLSPLVPQPAPPFLPLTLPPPPSPSLPLPVPLAVPVVSYLTGSSYQMEIPLFSYIPTFMVQKNYLPTGMLFIIPLMFASFLYHAKQYLNISPIKVLLLLMIIFWADYLLLYQWLLQLGYFLEAAYSSQTFLSVYGMLMLIWGTPFCYYAYKKANLSVGWLQVGGVVFYTFFFLLIFKMGAYYLRWITSKHLIW